MLILLPSRLAAVALVLVATAIALIAYVAPEDADQGLNQKIFYFHVPIALTAYVLSAGERWKALLHLWKRDQAPISRATSRSTRA